MLQRKNKIGDRGAECIGEGLKVNSSLQKLYLVRLVVFICVCIVVYLLGRHGVRRFSLNDVHRVISVAVHFWSPFLVLLCTASEV